MASRMMAKGCPTGRGWQKDNIRLLEGWQKAGRRLAESCKEAYKRLSEG